MKSEYITLVKIATSTMFARLKLDLLEEHISLLSEVDHPIEKYIDAVAAADIFLSIDMITGIRRDITSFSSRRENLRKILVALGKMRVSKDVLRIKIEALLVKDFGDIEYKHVLVLAEILSNRALSISYYTASVQERRIDHLRNILATVCSFSTVTVKVA